MAELMLINPRRRRKKGKAVRAKKRGKRRMSALQRKYFGKRKGNPIMARKSKRGRRRSVSYTVGKSRIRRRKLNPSSRGFSMRGFARNTLMPSAVGAAGALGIDIIIGFLPLPAAMKTGPMRTVAKIVGAAAIGAVAANFVKRETAQQIAAGAITVALYDLIKGTVVPMLPPAVQASIMTMGEMPYMEEYPSLDYAGAGMTADGISEYVSEQNVGMYVGDNE